MILYRGELMEDSRQEELLASLETDLYAPLRRGDRLETETVIRAFDALARRVLEGQFDEKSLLREIDRLLETPEELQAMSKAMAALSVPDATDKIVDKILSLTRK